MAPITWLTERPDHSDGDGPRCGLPGRKKMNLTFRAAELSDIADMFVLRARTRENAITRAELARLGITRASTAALLNSGRLSSWVCAEGSALVGFCSGDTASGEVLVLAVLPRFERRGIGKRLLLSVVETLRRAGCQRPWLAASSDRKVRSHGYPVLWRLK